MASFTGNNHSFSQCYYFMRQIEHCYEAQLYPSTACKPKIEDYLECLRRHKANEIIAVFQNQLITSPVINVPHYDKVNDQFIFDDGHIISNTDPIFRKYHFFD